MLSGAAPPTVVGTAGARAKGSVASAKLSEPDRRIEVSRVVRDPASRNSVACELCSA